MTPQIAFLINQALQSLSAGNLKTAELYLNQALKLNPKNTHALRFLGVIAAQQDQWEKALDFFRRSIKADPKNAIAYSNLGNVFLELEKYKEAIANYDKAIALDPKYAEAWSNKGNALTKLKKFESALKAYSTALLTNPNYTEAWSNKGACLGAMQLFDEAIAHVSKGIEINPNYSSAWLNLGQIYGDMGQHEQSLQSYEKALQKNPSADFLEGLTLYLKALIGDWATYQEDINSLLVNVTEGKKATPPLAFLSFIDSPKDQLKVAQIWAKNESPTINTLAAITKYQNQKIKIAYFSADFRDHPVSYLTAELFELHNRNRFEIYGFSTRKAEASPIRTRLISSFDHFIEVDDLSDKEVAVLARQLQIDIAIDLGGHTQHARTGIFAHRAAPIQVNYLGFAGTMGATYIDYIIADKIVIPAEFSECYTEKKVYLPHSYMVDDSKRQPANKKNFRAEFGLPEDGVIFCCFNNSYKFNPTRVASFAKILIGVPNSVIWVTGNNPSFRKNLIAEFAKNGIPNSRIIFADPIAAMEDHLARYQLADLFLDTSPYNAHTTALDSLKGGTPIVSLIGKSFASRVGASLLTTVGLPELIVQSEEEFIALSIKLGKDPHALQLLKEKLSNNLKITPLFDTNLFCKHLEIGYQAMHQKHLENLPPSDIYINPQ